MKNRIPPLFLLFGLIGCLVGACASAHTATPAGLESSSSPNPADALGGFPLAKGTTWVYSYTEYQPTPSNPTRTTTATYEFTERVADVQWQQAFFIAHVLHQERLVKSDPEWIPSGSTRPDETWYVVKGGQVYEALQPMDWSKVQTDALLLAYDLPLMTGKSWCPSSYVKGVEIQDCTAAGKRSVVSHSGFTTPAGRFTDCYQVTEDVNSGGVTRWLCEGVGVVTEKYDHAGSRFGFEQVLVSFTKGSP